MELRQLKYFSKTMELGSLGKAAKAFGMNTSAISQQVSKLESELSTRLLQRTPYGIKPTIAGVAFYQKIQLVTRYLEDAIDAAQSERLVGSIKIGLPTSTSRMLGVDLLKELTHQYPNIKVNIMEGLSGDLVNALHNRLIDIAIIFRPEEKYNLDITPVLEEQLYLIFHQYYCQKQYAFLKDDIVALDKLEHIPLILPSEKHGLRRLINAKSVNLNIITEVDGLYLIMDCVRNGLAATIQPSSVLHSIDQDDSLIIKEIDPDIKRINYIASISEVHELSPIGLIVRSVLKRIMQNHVHHKIWNGATLIS